MPARTELFVRRTPGGVFTIANESHTTGARIFVHSVTGTDAAGYGSNPDAPYATLAYALTAATASKGDTIYLMPGHAEAVIAAGTITVATIGVRIIGLGQGSLRPTFTWTTANTATWLVTAADVLIRNVIFDLTGIAVLVNGISVTAAGCAF